MADAEQRRRTREERRRQRKEKEKNGKINQDNHLNGDPDISRQTGEGLEQKSEATLPDVVKASSGLNDDWERTTSPEEGFARGKNGYKSYSSAVAAKADKSGLQKKKEQYTNTVLTGRRYDSDEDAEFEPEVQSSQTEVVPASRPSGNSEPTDDEWSQLPPQQGNGENKFYTEEELRQIDAGSESSGERSRKVSEEWKRTARSTESRGVIKPKSHLKKSDSWIRERPALPEEPVLEEPPWLALVRKRRWRSTVKARFPQSERERIQFERRLDTSKKGLKFNPRGEPVGITGPDMDDELSMYLIQQRKRIESDDVFESSLASSSRSGMSSIRSVSESDFDEQVTFDEDPKNREMAAEKGILNLSRPPIKGPKKEVHKNLAMEKSRQSTMKWRFSNDPLEDPLWTKLPRPSDVEALNDMEANLEAKFWTSKKKFQTGQFDPPPVHPKPGSSSSSLSRSHSASEIDFDRRSSRGSCVPEEELTPIASKSNVKNMRQRLSSGEYKTSTPLTGKPVELEQGYLPRLRDLQQKLADEAGSAKEKAPKPTYISQEELESMGERKKSISEETFTEKSEDPKPVEKPRMRRRRSDAELFDLLASRKEEADANAVEMTDEISSLASDISKAFGKEEGDQRQEKQGEQQQQWGEKRQEKTREVQNREESEEKQRQKELNEQQRAKERDDKKNAAKESSNVTSPEFLVKLKDCEVLEGNDISFEVVVSGEPQPTVEWFLDERLVKPDKRHKILGHGAVHSLTITDITVDDEGIYECVATNSAGKAKCDCEMLVND